MRAKETQGGKLSMLEKNEKDIVMWVDWMVGDDEMYRD